MLKFFKKFLTNGKIIYQYPSQVLNPVYFVTNVYCAICRLGRSHCTKVRSENGNRLKPFETLVRTCSESNENDSAYTAPRNQCYLNRIKKSVAD
jgi:hypothetical protein